MTPLRSKLHIDYQQKTYRTNQNAEPFLLQNIDLPNDSVAQDLNPRWFMSAIGSLLTGEVRPLVPRSE